jgi:hypothetical protein
MPRNGSGIYVLPAGNPVVPGTVIQTAWANGTMSDIAAALTGSVSVDGQTPATANLPMGGFKHTGVAPATADDEYATAGQVQHQSFNVVQAAAMATVNVYTGTMPLGITSFTDGMFAILVVPNPGSNTGPATLNINGSGPHNILDGTGGPLSAGALAPGNIALLGWDGTNWRSVLGGAGSALGYTPVNKAGDTMTGPLTVPSIFTVVAPATVGQPSRLNFEAPWIPTVANQAFCNIQGNAQQVAAGPQLLGAYFSFRSGGAWDATHSPGKMMFHTTAITAGASPTLAQEINPDQTVRSTRGFFVTPFSYAPAAGAAITLDFTGGPAAGAGAGNGAQTVQVTLAGNLTLTDVLTPLGAMMRIFFYATTLGTVTWPSYVKWPGGAAAPVLSSGPLKHAIVTICNNGTWALANASVY